MIRYRAEARKYCNVGISCLGAAVVVSLWKMPENAIQAVASAVIFFLIAAAFDKADIKTRILG